MRSRFVPALYDLLATTAAWMLAYAIRFDFQIPNEHRASCLQALPVVVSVHIWLFWVNGTYRGVWKYFHFSDLTRMIRVVAIATPASLAAVFFINPLLAVPRLIWPISATLLLLLTTGARLLYRQMFERRLAPRARTEGGARVLILGAGVAGVGLHRELARHDQWNVAGYLDDNPALHGRLIFDSRVHGSISSLPEISATLGIQQVILAMPSATPAQRRKAAEICKQAGVAMLTVPSWSDLLSGKVEVSQIRKVEIEDLLGRGPVSLDDSGLGEFLGNKVVMVTGAAGSIGSELCRRIAHFKPRLLVFYEMSEAALYHLEQEFSARGDIPFVTVVGDIKNEARLNSVLSRYEPSVIFHAAAYKHVPLMEEENAWEAVQNNVRGTLVVARAAKAHRVPSFVLVSSDKAVNPRNVMGATKLAAEMALQAMQKQSTATKYIVVRFGNVLGSTGSVIPKFREQIARGGPVTVTHPEIERYFMSIPEAAQLVLQAALMGQGGEVFVLDMGSPIKILDLARLMIKLSGFSEQEIAIQFTGLRPGEKMSEELVADGESELATPHPKLRIARSRPVDDAWLAACAEWIGSKLDSLPTDEEVRAMLVRLLPSYRPERAASREKTSIHSSPRKASAN